MKKRNLYTDLNLESKESNTLYVNTMVIQEQVIKNISSASCERKVSYMKSKKKFIILAAAAVMLLSVTVYAASGMIATWYSSSSPADELKSIPSAKECTEELGYAPVLLDSFSNGYDFDSASFKKNALADENNKIVEKFKSISCRYTKDDETVLLSADKFNSTVEEAGKIYANIDGINVYAHSFNNKIVPPDYKMTEDDKAAEAAGEVYFNEDGIDHFEDHFINSVSWEKDGIRYDLMQSNGTLTIDDLVLMAQELINN